MRGLPIPKGVGIYKYTASTYEGPTLDPFLTVLGNLTDYNIKCPSDITQLQHRRV